MEIDIDLFPQITRMMLGKFKGKDLDKNLCAQYKQEIENNSFD